MASQLMQPPPLVSSSVLGSKIPSLPVLSLGFSITQQKSGFVSRRFSCRRSSKWSLGVSSNKEDTEVSVASTSGSASAPQENVDPDAQDLEYISQIKRVSKLCKPSHHFLYGFICRISLISLSCFFPWVNIFVIGEPILLFVWLRFWDCLRLTEIWLSTRYHFFFFKKKTMTEHFLLPLHWNMISVCKVEW